MKHIAILTSGGDAPGMNACLRAAVRTALFHKIKISGVSYGYDGLIHNEIRELDASSVGNIIHRGGTILGTARSQEFFEQEGRAKAAANLQSKGIDGLIVIGGDGSFKGLNKLVSEFPAIKAIGIPGTIDNDLFGTDFTIGFDTALNTVVEAVDKIRDTANSHNRLFFVEVMGRDGGQIALYSGIASGAEAILIPETPTYIDNLVAILQRGWSHQKTGYIIIVAEGDEAGGAFKISEEVKSRFNQYETKVSVLGHIQRGGSPSCMDRVLATRMGHEAVLALMQGDNRVMIGQINGEMKRIPIENAIKHVSEINRQLIKMAEIVSI